MAENQTNRLTLDYDDSTDVLHVSFGTGEPSFGEEIDDHIVMDFGIYTGAPTGFQVLHVKETGVNSIHVMLKKKLPHLVQQKCESLKAIASDRAEMMRKAVESFPKRAGDLVSVS